MAKNKQYMKIIRDIEIPCENAELIEKFSTLSNATHLGGGKFEVSLTSEQYNALKALPLVRDNYQLGAAPCTGRLCIIVSKGRALDPCNVFNILSNTDDN